MKQPDMHSAKRFIRPITYGVLAGAAACLLFLLVMSLVMSLKDIPQAVISLSATVIFVLGGFVAGLVASGCSREKGMLMGLACGLCLFVVLSIASFAAGCGGEFGVLALTKLAAVLLASALGGVIGVNRKKKFR